jgi:hypothetical protein
MSGVTVRKWYLDCVTTAGDAAIVYAGRVTLGPMSVPYFELLTAPAGGPAARLRRVSGRARITAAGRELALEAAPLRVTGRWTPRHAPIDASLLDDARGRITWRCRQPGGLATLRLPDGSTLDGLGYAEELEMTVAPWALPFDELRWGRFVNDRRSVVWIDWRGRLDRRWVWADGAAVDASVVDRDRVAWPGATVEIEPGRVLRHDRIGKTVAGALAVCLPRRVSQAVETKWVSQAVLRDDRGAAETGWVIHEAVRWG